MPIRRHCDPVNVKLIWNAIRSATSSHLVSDAARITRYLMKNEKCTQMQSELYIKQALKDKLILTTRRQTGDTSPAHFKITNQELPDLDGKDWYCFECHLAGEVTACANCFRVFHTDCVKSARRKFEAQRSTNPTEDSEASNRSGPDKSITDYVYNESLCSVCNIINIDACLLEKAELNYLLKFVLHRIRAWLPNTITHTMAQEDRPEWLTDSELTWRANQLFFEHRDMSVIEVKLNTESYELLSEFLADILTVQHNVALFHGTESQEHEAADLMLRDTIYDITEIKNCPDCYKHSNEKINPKWFSLPCRNPHKLVWAKQKGYPYWPAKVIKETGSHFDVRFFGGKYERAVLVKSLIKPISMSANSLQIKPSAYFNKAVEELKYHQKLLADPQELEKVRSEGKRKRSVGRPKSLGALTTPPTASTSTTVVQNNRRHTSASLETAASSDCNMTALTAEPVEKLTAKRRNSDLEPVSIDNKKSKKDNDTSTSSSHNQDTSNIIDISDGEEEPKYSVRDSSVTQETYPFDDTFEQVTSSTTENYRSQISPPQEVGMQQLDQPYSDAVERMRRKVEALPNKKDIIKCAMDCMQIEIDRITNDHNDHLKRLFESHNAQISETKKKQWCYNCEQDAIYHCCWNTAYCSQTCQQQHWQAEHKKVCRRKR